MAVIFTIDSKKWQEIATIREEENNFKSRHYRDMRIIPEAIPEPTPTEGEDMKGKGKGRGGKGCK